MASESQTLHFILFPLMAQGHTVPMLDIARLLASQGTIVTIITTPLNAKRFKPILSRAIQSGLKIQFFELQFPNQNSKLPKDCENLDMLPSLGISEEFFLATYQFQEPAEKLLQELKPKPDCIISDMLLPYTSQIATNLGIPRIVFDGTSCFNKMCNHSIIKNQILETVESEFEYFVLPGLPHRIEITKNQSPFGFFKNSGEFGEQIRVAEMVTYGVIINTFEELESEYIQEFKKVGGNKLWCIGPVSLYNKDKLDMVERGYKAAIDEHECLNWLDLQKQDSVLYVCFGSICNLVTSQLIELALGLEASNRPFIWTLRGGERLKELEKWIEEGGFEKRTKERGMLIRGWAPQVLILSHPAIGGFLTHCGWNSILEGITAGKPLVTWPLFGDQFFNERLVVEVLKIGVKVGAEVTIVWGEEEEIGDLIKREKVKRAIDKLMDGGEENEEIRKKVKELGFKAKKAMEENGSSYLNMKLLIEDIIKQKIKAN